MQKIIPYLWFDRQAEEAVNFYVSLFKNSKVGTVARYGEAGAKASGMPVGEVMNIDFELAGLKFGALNGGPLFKFNQTVSFFVTCETEEEIDALWSKLSDGGKIMMEYQAYPFSKKYGWVADKYGISWQVSLNPGVNVQKIRPCLMFTGRAAGRAEEAINLYTSLIANSETSFIARYPEDSNVDAGKIMHAAFSLGGYGFIAMDSSVNHNADFTQAISFMVNCESQEEIDRLTVAFTDGGQQQPCGWVVDQFGVPWQIVPTLLGELMTQGDAGAQERVMGALMHMTKIDCAALQQAFDQK